MMLRPRKEKPAPPTSLDDILSGEDQWGLLEDIQTGRETTNSREDRWNAVLRTFESINTFYERHKRIPIETSGDRYERRLGRALAGLRDDRKVAERLADIDGHGLLAISDSRKSVNDPRDNARPDNDPTHSQSEGPLDLDSILAGDSMGLLEVDEEEVDIFDLRHVKSVHKDRNDPDEIAERKTCEDFPRFVPLFDTVHQRLKSGEAEMIRFTHDTQIQEGDFFVLRGVMCLVDEIGDRGRDINDRNDARMRVIYENGTESNLLLRSLSRALYKDKRGKRVLDHRQDVDRMKGLSHRDHPTGTLYVLRSLREDKVIRERHNLYKIGLTTGSVEDRIRNAEREPTYLEGPVEIVRRLKTYNLDIQQLERLIHSFFGPRRANFLLQGRNGRSYRPREWFEVPLDSIQLAVEQIINGDINAYRLDVTSGLVLPRNQGRKRDTDQI